MIGCRLGQNDDPIRKILTSPARREILARAFRQSGLCVSPIPDCRLLTLIGHEMPLVHKDLTPMTLGFPLIILLACAAADEAKTVSPAEQLAALAKRGIEIHDNFYSELRKAGQDRALASAANNKYRDDAAAWAASVTPLIEANPTEHATLDLILAMNEIHHVDDRLVLLLREHHFTSPKVLRLLNSFSQDSPGARRSFAEEVAEKHADRAVRGKASLALGRMDRIYLIDGLKDRPSFGGRLGTPDELRIRAREYLERVVKNYADVPSDDEGEMLGELAQDELAGLDNIGRLEIGKVAPDIVGQDLDGKPLKWTANSGKVTLLVFWGSWCGPCMRLVPHEATLKEKYKGRPFQLYGINGGDEREVAKETAVEKQMTWPSFYGARKRGGLAAVWNVDAWPAVYVIGSDGVIRYKGHGDEMEAAVEKAVAQAEGTAP
jgi:thiol-disulfide isomerase/thioredoxin